MTDTDINTTKAKLHIALRSFGVKTNSSFPHADLYIDCRGVPDPSHAVITAQEPGTGDMIAQRQWVKERVNLTLYTDLIADHLRRLTTRRGVGLEYDKPFNILTLCAHGIHRSRAMKWLLAERLHQMGFQHVEVKGGGH